MAKLWRAFSKEILRPGYTTANGVEKLSWTDWYKPGQYLPRWIAMGSKKKYADLLYKTGKLWQSPAKERFELMLCGEKLFEGGAVPLKREHSQKFPELNSDDGVFAPSSQLVVLYKPTSTTPEAIAAVDAWEEAYPGTTTRLIVTDTGLGRSIIAYAEPAPGKVTCSSLDCRPLYQLIATNNTGVPYAFLVDSEGLIRWRSCWKPTEKEKEFLKFKWAL
eukprot:TRINITY_DN27433_c0_g1_i1.p1 TRINITY_DN27433_c0_g1~~TRINITY_DN27433_c0_g1_i1.p1  ORF type:complete len:226 (+),score=44.01 TRINITY_DN27433_c0_g1_i1:22-678(+)